MLKIIFKYEWRSLLRNKFLLLALTLVMLAGLYGIYYGTKTISSQKQNIAFIQAQQQEHWQKALANFTADTTTAAGMQAFQTIASPGFARARHSLYAIFEPAPLAALAIGQRDMFAYAIPLSGQSLYIQLFRDEIANPLKLLSGNFDLTFVFIYLFPLLIIAFGYQVLSAEQEQGTYPLLRLQAGPIGQVILTKLLFYYLLVATLVLFLSVVGFWAAGIPVAGNGLSILIWLVIILLYCLFWMALVFLVTAFNQSSIFNAVGLLSLWLLFLIIIPSVLNMVTALRHPVEYTHLSNVIRRTSLHETPSTMDSLLSAYYMVHPEYRPVTNMPLKMKKAKGYAAFTDLSDARSGELVKIYQDQLLARMQGINRLNIINPAVSTQQLLNALAHTDAADFIHYQRALVPFHKQIINFFYTRLFTDKTFVKEDYKLLPKFYLKERPIEPGQIISTITQLTLLIALLSVFGWIVYLTRFNF